VCVECLRLFVVSVIVDLVVFVSDIEAVPYRGMLCHCKFIHLYNWATEREC